MTATEKFRAKKGLEGVIFDTTEVSNVLPEEKSLYYRGYPVHELATLCTFEEVAYLILNGELPNQSQLEGFKELERSSRALPKELIEVIERMPTEGHPMDAVRTAVSFLGMLPEFRGAESPETAIRKGISLLAKIPTVIAAVRRLKVGESISAPSEELSLSENFFQMCFGEVPDAEVVAAFDGALTLYAEHGFNASTFTARVIVSTQSDLCSAVSGAIGALKGNLHGGANEAVMHMLLDIGSPENAQAWIDNALENKLKVMGFGHRLYRLGDSRVPTMTGYRKLMSERCGGERWEAISQILEDTMVGRKKIYPNLDFPAGPVYYMMGFEIPLYTPIFVMARVVGWTAHVAEQLTDNRLVRPSGDYIGAAPREVVAIGQR